MHLSLWVIPMVAGIVLIETGIRRFARSREVPKWAADEAYIARLRRWHRTRARS
jgi:hypothetical protein